MLSVLIVDDDPGIREPTSVMLEDSGFKTKQVSSGNEVIEAFDDSNYDIVLLDKVMDDMDGLQVLRHIKTVKPATIVIMITAYASIKGGIRAIKEGATDYIPKPFGYDELLETINNSIKVNYIEKYKNYTSLYHTNSYNVVKAVSNPIRRNSLEYLYSKGHQSFMKMVKEMKIKDHTKLAFHLRKLRRCGLINQGENREYFITTRGKEVLRTINDMEVKLKLYV